MPNEIVIEAMIKGLRPGPTTQYFARKPPQTLEKLLQKVAEAQKAVSKAQVSSKLQKVVLWNAA
jgi:uroporphyrinogen-III decarboxylase